ncbi:MAG TPA: ABC transporter permease [Vicinamibacterales bacterium]|nr:ABC transporter permease [Vicinamibacterales bacterium]
MPEWNAALAARLASLRLAPAREREIIEELSQHLDDRYEELRRDGRPHGEAVALALEEITDEGLLAREMQPLRQAATPPPIVPGAPRARWLNDLGQDVRYAARLLLQGRAWTLVVIALLALGIGANTALFSATDAMLFSSVPVKDPASLVRFHWAGRNDLVTEQDEFGFIRPAAGGQRVRGSMSYPVYQQFAANAAPFADLFALYPDGEINVVIDGQAELANGDSATGNYFSVLGVNARAGRVFTPDDDRPSSPPVAVISSRYWLSRFGNDPAVVGKTIKANDVLVTIIGVLPAGFTGVQHPVPDRMADVVFPLSLDLQLQTSTGRSEGSLLTRPTAWWLQVMGRLHPNATGAQLQAALDGPFKRTARANFDAFLKDLPDDRRNSPSYQNRTQVPQLIVDSARSGFYDADDGVRTSAMILTAVVFVVLLIVCANVANLMLSRAVGRRREISVRLSLGATRSRLVRQLLTEALLLALAGAALGIVVAVFGVGLLPAPASSASVFRGPVLLFAIAAAVVTSLLFGVVPALRATSVDVNAELKEMGRSIAGRRSVLARSLLVVQVALSLVLLVGAGLFLRTLTNLRRVDIGFDPHDILLVRLTPATSGYNQPRSVELFRTLIDRLGAIPGVRAASLSQPALLSGSTSSTGIFVEGDTNFGRTSDVGTPGNERDRSHDINRLIVWPGYFRLLGLPVVMGRDLTPHDDRSSLRVTIINETAARTFFPNENPLGKRFTTSPGGKDYIEIVGVVRDAKYSSVREPAPPTMYDSFMQNPRATAFLTLRTEGPPSAVAPAVRQTIHDTDPNLPIVSIATQVESIERRFSQERLFAQAYALFGGIALLLASVGLFGLMSYNVARRTPEMGIRMALGAQRGSVLSMVMSESMRLVAIGVAVGVAVALAASRFVSTLVYGLNATDALTMIIAVTVLSGVSALAAYLPARRASHVDPAVALRAE